MSSWVLDASAVIASVNGERGGDRVAAVLGEAVISSVNMAEVLTRLIEQGGSREQALDDFDVLGIGVAAFDAELALQAAALRPATRSLGLSLGDRACLATARRLALPAMTTDRAWAGLDVGVEVVLIR